MSRASFVHAKFRGCRRGAAVSWHGKRYTVVHSVGSISCQRQFWVLTGTQTTVTQSNGFWSTSVLRSTFAVALLFDV